MSNVGMRVRLTSASKEFHVAVSVRDGECFLEPSDHECLYPDA